MKFTSGLLRMNQIFKAKIPVERVGALIGPSGLAKKKIESVCHVKLIVNSESGDIDIIGNEGCKDPTFFFKAQNIITAVGRGFSPEKAFKLLNDDVFLHVVDLREVIGKSKSDLERLKGRLIGKEGKTRKIIEETTNANISIYGHTVSIIGKVEELEVAKEAISKLLSGYQHKTVYNFLGKRRHEMKKEKLKLWEE
jgi:ribosomal RNA assembly protein